MDTINSGGQGHIWVTDFAKFGVTANHNAESGEDSSLYAADLTLRKSTSSWIKLQAGRTDGLVSTTLSSDDGGFQFDNTIAPLQNQDAYGYRVDLSVGLADWLSAAQGQIHLYGQRLEAGYSAPGLNTSNDLDQYGGVLRMPITTKVDIVAKADRSVEDQGLETIAAEVDVGYQVSKHWTVQAGARHDEREDKSAVVVATQEEGDRTDAVLQVEYDTKGRWRTYAFGQGTVRSTGDRDENHRGGVGGAYRINDKLSVDAEASHGTLGPAGEVGTTYQHDERNKVYMNYALDTERGYDGVHERRGKSHRGLALSYFPIVRVCMPRTNTNTQV